MRAIAMSGASEHLEARYLLQKPAGMSQDAGDMSIPTLGGTLMSPHSNPTQIASAASTSRTRKRSRGDGLGTGSGADGRSNSHSRSGASTRPRR